MFKLLRLPLRLLSGSCWGLFRRQRLRRSNVTLVESELPRSSYLTCSSYLRGYGHSTLLEQSRISQMNVQIVDALRSGDEGKASGLLWNNDCEQLSVEDLLYILEYCPTAPKPLFAMELWKVNQKCSMLMLLSLINGGYLDQALKWLKLLGKNLQTKPPLSIFNAFLSSCNQNSGLANKCLQLMDEQFIGRSEETYGELLKLAVQENNLKMKFGRNTANTTLRDLRTSTSLCQLSQN